MGWDGKGECWINRESEREREKERKIELEKGTSQSQRFLRPFPLYPSPFLPPSSLRKTKITKDTTARTVVLTADRPVRAPTDPFCRPLDFVATLIPWNRSLRPQGSRLLCTVQYACYPERDSVRERENVRKYSVRTGVCGCWYGCMYGCMYGCLCVNVLVSISLRRLCKLYCIVLSTCII